MSSASNESVLVGGDSTAPSFASAALVRVDAQDANSILVELSEAIDSTSLSTPNITLNASGATSVSLEGDRTVRATWASAVTVGHILVITGIEDVAGNDDTINQSLAAALAVGPTLVGVSGTAVAGEGGDFLVVEFDMAVDPTTGFDASNYTLTQNGQAIDLTGATLRAAADVPGVRVELASGVELLHGAALSASVADVENLDGFAMTTAAVAGTAVGDSTAPQGVASAIHLRIDSEATTAELLFDEALDPSSATDLSNWSAPGGNSVVAVSLPAPNVARVRVSSPLGSGAQISASGVTDAAGNPASVTFTLP